MGITLTFAFSQPRNGAGDRPVHRFSLRAAASILASSHVLGLAKDQVAGVCRARCWKDEQMFIRLKHADWQEPVEAHRGSTRVGALTRLKPGASA